MGLFEEWQPQFAEAGIATLPAAGKLPLVKNYLKMGIKASGGLVSKYGEAEQLGFVCGAARVQGYRPEQLIGGITQGSREIIVLAEDLDGTEWPVPPKKGDKVFVRGRQLAVEVVDDSTARIGGVIVAYIMTATG